MRFQKTTIFAVIAAVLLVGSTAGMAVAQGGYQLNPDADEHPDTYFAEDRLTVEQHDRSSMNWLQYENDNGNVETVDAHVNGSDSGAKVAYRADQIDVDAFRQFPRVDSEDGNNSVTFLNANNWTTANGATVSDTDGATADGVQSIEIASSGSVTSGSTESATYAKPDVTSDAEKRYLQFVGNVDSLSSGSEVAVQVRDSDGDYVEAVINSSRDATADDVIANQTASGVIYQEQLGQLTVKGSGDGSLDGVAETSVEVRDADATVTIVGLNVEKKSRWDFGAERVPDTSTDDSGDYTDETVYERPAGGEIEAADFADMGEAFSSATIAELGYLDVHYRMQDDPSAVSIEWTDGDAYPNFPHLLDVSYRTSIPTAYDLTHGTITLEVEQSFLSERYVQLRYAEAVGDTETGDIAESDWIDLSGSLGDVNSTITADNTVQPDSEYVVQQEIKVLQEQHDALQPTQSAGGFWGGSGSSGGPFTSMYNWLAGGIVSLLTMFGLAKRGS
ncbi:hypothetical protein GWK26_11880 [haloarchaeon 3A1-DGR]|nr:hypothetical protein GWK26_11880 [haloarchaeon 3A1-DGR]